MRCSRVSRFASILFLSIFGLCMQACSAKLQVSVGSGPNDQQSQSGTGSIAGAPGPSLGGSSGGSDSSTPAVGEVIVSGITDWMDDEVECDVEGQCASWVDI